MNYNDIENIKTLSEEEVASASAEASATNAQAAATTFSVNNAPTETVNLTTAGTSKFNDVTADQMEAANYVANRGYMTGISDTSFNPNGKVTRAMLTQMIYAMEGKPPVNGNSQFSDVTNTAWYSNAVIWAKNNGIISGYDDGTFKPGDEITNEQAVAILRQYANYKGFDTKGYINLGDYYKDTSSVSDWARDAYTWAVDNEIYTGDVLNPKAGVSRIELATMLQAFDHAYEGELGLVPINGNIAPSNSYNIPSINDNIGTTPQPGTTTQPGTTPTGQTTTPAETVNVTPQPSQNTAQNTNPFGDIFSNFSNFFNMLTGNNASNAAAATANGVPASSSTNPTGTSTASKFRDVKASDADAVNYVSSRNLMVGTGDNTFNPDGKITRAQMVQILYSMSGSPSNVGGHNSFTDVQDGSWYSNAVSWAQNTGLVAGYDDGTFRPDQTISREQAAAILKRYAEQSGEDLSTYKVISNNVDYNSLRDTGDVSNYAKDAVRWAVGDGMFDVSSGSINPKGEVTRAEFAKILMNYDINYNDGSGKGSYNITPIQNPGVANTVAPSTSSAAASTTSAPTKSVSEVAAEVINGNWGNGDERRQRLEAAGYNYSEVQAAVNSQFSSGGGSSYSSSGTYNNGGVSSSNNNSTSSNKYGTTDVWTRTNPNATYNSKHVYGSASSYSNSATGSSVQAAAKDAQDTLHREAHKTAYAAAKQYNTTKSLSTKGANSGKIVGRGGGHYAK